MLIPPTENYECEVTSIDDLYDFVASEYSSQNTTKHVLESAYEIIKNNVGDAWSSRAEQDLCQFAYEILKLPSQYGFPAITNYFAFSQGISSRRNSKRLPLDPLKLLELGCYMSEVISEQLEIKSQWLKQLREDSHLQSQYFNQQLNPEISSMMWGFIPPRRARVSFCPNDSRTYPKNQRAKQNLPLRSTSIPVISAFRAMNLQPNDFDEMEIPEIFQQFNKEVNGELGLGIDWQELSAISISLTIDNERRL